MYNAADENQVKDKQAEAKTEREQELDDIKELLKTPFGKRFFKRFMAEGMIFHSSFTGNSRTFFNEGRRSLTLKFFADMTQVAPESTIVEIMINKQED